MPAESLFDRPGGRRSRAALSWSRPASPPRSGGALRAPALTNSETVRRDLAVSIKEGTTPAGWGGTGALGEGAGRGCVAGSAE